METVYLLYCTTFLDLSVIAASFSFYDILKVSQSPSVSSVICD